MKNCTNQFNMVEFVQNIQTSNFRVLCNIFNKIPRIIRNVYIASFVFIPETEKLL